MWTSFRQRGLRCRKTGKEKAGGIQQGKRNYNEYVFSLKEKILCLGEGMTLVSFLGYFFYRSIWGIAAVSPLCILYWEDKKKRKGRAARQELKAEFKECILGISSSLKAGYSVENAFRDSLQEMRMLFGEESLIVKELWYIRNGLDNNRNPEVLLADLGNRSGIEEIREFGEVFAIAKRNGGSMPEIIQTTAALISDKAEADREIQVLISGKKMEQKIMSIVPFGIVTYVQITSKGFFDVLYHNMAGVLVMSVCLILYLAAYEIGSRITEIKE